MFCDVKQFVEKEKEERVLGSAELVFFVLIEF
jgi:hypothetical protein